MPDFNELHIHGDAHFADAHELARGNWFTPGGVFMGYDPDSGRPLYYNGEGHILTVAPSGFGKTHKLIVPNLLTYDRGSVVVTDPKGQVSAITMAHRKKAFGNRIVILNPWRDEIAQKSDDDDTVGVDLGDTGYNPLRTLLPDDPSIFDKAGQIFSIICPDRPQESESSRFFIAVARTLLMGSAIYLAQTQGRVTLPMLHDYVRGPDATGWAKRAGEWMALGEPDLSGFAGSITSSLGGKGQWSAIQTTMEKATAIYSPLGALGRHLMRDEFDPADLKREKITVYIVIPSSRRTFNQDWLALVLSTIAESVGSTSKSSPVLLVAEEFANLGHMAMMSQAMAEYREAGLKVHLILQNQRQLAKTYGQAEASELLNLSNVRQYFAINELETAEEVSKTLGTFTHHEYAEPPETWFGKRDPVGPLIGRYNEPLMRVSELMNMPEGRQIIISTGETPPIWGLLKGYWNDPGMMAHAGQNPLRAPPEPPLPGRLARMVPERLKEAYTRRRDRITERLPVLPPVLRAALSLSTRMAGKVVSYRKTHTAQGIFFWGAFGLGAYLGGVEGGGIGFFVGLLLIFLNGRLPASEEHKPRYSIRVKS